MMQFLKKCVCFLNKPQYVINKRREFDAINVIRRFKHESDIVLKEYEENEEEKDIYKQVTKEYLGTVIGGNSVFVIQPYIKWGIDKKRNTSPQLQLEEAVALINTLPNWSVIGTKLVPLLSLQRKELVGTGTRDTLKEDIKKCKNITAIFVSTTLLKFVQLAALQEIFQLPVYDRYAIVIHIFREHAKTQEAKLQVALAELPYVRQKMIDLSSNSKGRINYDEKTKFFLHARERKLKNALEKLKEHRHMIKQKRCSYGFPSIAVVGYTNAGKTSLIKALTADDSLQPEDKLFATLDTTLHQGYLPNRLKVLYVDTIGFIQDVPEMLIEPFKVTLEDAISANILIHVFDVSHPDLKAQIQHVEKTIQHMVNENKVIINVANKYDKIKEDINRDILPENTFVVSATKLTGIDLLRSKVEEEIMNAANLVKKRIRVQTGSEIASWLYNKATVLSAEPDPKNSQHLIMDVCMSEKIFYQFKRDFRI